MESDIADVAGMISPARTRVPETEGAAHPWLSILVPVYNVLPYLEECLSSIFGEMADDGGIELILIDDRSTDGSAELCARLIAHAGDNVRLIHHEENQGISAVRNALLEAAGGDYLWFIDSDDMLLPGSVAALRDILLSEQPDIVICDYLRADQTQIATFSGPARQSAECIQTLIAGTFANRRMHCWSRIWKRGIIGETRFPEGACFEDIATVPWLMLKARSYYYCPEPWIYYRSRPGSIIAQVSRVRGHFDTRRNDDLAASMNGFANELTLAFPELSEETKAAVGRFVAREFFKLSRRLFRARRQQPSLAALRLLIGHYRAIMERNSPVPFSQVAIQYLRRGQLVRAAELWLALTGSARVPAGEPLPERSSPSFA